MISLDCEFSPPTPPHSHYYERGGHHTIACPEGVAHQGFIQRGEGLPHNIFSYPNRGDHEVHSDVHKMGVA
jgi:hypothetical protein